MGKRYKENAYLLEAGFLMRWVVLDVSSDMWYGQCRGLNTELPFRWLRAICLKHYGSSNFKWLNSVHGFKWLYFWDDNFLWGYIFMWLIIHLAPRSSNYILKSKRFVHWVDIYWHTALLSTSLLYNMISSIYGKTIQRYILLEVDKYTW